MKLENEFMIDAPAGNVWDFFLDIPAIAQCLPGAKYIGETEDGKHMGSLNIKLGPFNGVFEGVSEVCYFAEERKVVVTGQGIDKKGASRGKMTMTCYVTETEHKTRVQTEADIQISGTIAQFGRSGMIQEVAKVLISDFTANAEAKLQTESIAAGQANSKSNTNSAAEPLSGLGLFVRVLKAWLTSVFRTRKA